MTWTGQPAFWKGLACHQTPDDLWNFAELLWHVQPEMTLEVGTGEGGTSTFLRGLCDSVQSVDLGDPIPITVPKTLVILDADVYSRLAVVADLDVYSPKAHWLVICHTVRQEWGAAAALADWWPAHPEWMAMDMRHPTRHTWLTR